MLGREKGAVAHTIKAYTHIQVHTTKDCFPFNLNLPQSIIKPSATQSAMER